MRIVKLLQDGEYDDLQASPISLFVWILVHLQQHQYWPDATLGKARSPAYTFQEDTKKLLTTMYQ